MSRRFFFLGKSAAGDKRETNTEQKKGCVREKTPDKTPTTFKQNAKR